MKTSSKCKSKWRKTQRYTKHHTENKARLSNMNPTKNKARLSNMNSTKNKAHTTFCSTYGTPRVALPASAVINHDRVQNVGILFNY